MLWQNTNVQEMSLFILLWIKEHTPFRKDSKTAQKFSDNLSHSRERLETLKAQLETAKVEAVKEFPQEQELAEKTERLGELNVLLDVGKSDKVMMDEEPDEK